MSTFNVSATTMRDEFFPQWGAFSANSNPTTTTVATIITQKYADLAGKLLIKGIAIATVDAASSSVGFSWCQETLGLMVAIRILQLVTQRDPELAKAYTLRLAERLGALETYGAAALGDRALDTGSSPSSGPTTFIDQMGITLPDDSEASTLAPFFRRDDPV